MMKYLILLLALVMSACEKPTIAGADPDKAPPPATQPAIAGLEAYPAEPIAKVEKTADEWKKILTPWQYHILREHGTEPPFKNEFNDNHEKGTYLCAACGLALFSSDHKFESGTGWPSFYQRVKDSHVKIATDADGQRDQLSCARCGGHLGHVFEDGPKPTGQRYCIDSASLCFVAANAGAK
jgi:peptide-methionine (R)-S-oxide reductase